MKYELNVYELGEFLKKIEKEHNLSILIKSTLSGGWMTITGEASIQKIPSEESHCCSKKDNIIDILIKAENEQGITIKLTGAKDKKFIIDISAARYRELSSNNLTINQIKVNENECKLRIDENIIFAIKANAENIEKLLISN